MRVGPLRLAALQRAETAQVQQIVELVLVSTDETRLNEAVDVGLAADDVQILLDPVGHAASTQILVDVVDRAGHQKDDERRRQSVAQACEARLAAGTLPKR